MTEQASVEARELQSRDVAFDLIGRVVQHMGDDLMFVTHHMTSETERKFYALRDEMRQWLIDEGAALDALASRPSPAAADVEAVARAMAYVIAKRHTVHDEPTESEVDSWHNDQRREEARAAIAAMPTTDRKGVLEEAAMLDAIYKVLRYWRLSTLVEEEEPRSGYPLVDAVSQDGGTIATGETELGEIAFEIAKSIRALTGGEKSGG